MIGDKELCVLRQKYYSLLVRLFWKEPEQDFILSLREGMAERVDWASQVSPTMAEGWETIGRFIADKDVGSVAGEFTELFLGPHQVDIIPYESYYLTGNLFRAPLIEVRGFMKKIGLEKLREQISEPEDILPFELEILNWLVSKQNDTDALEEEEKWLDVQAEFLKKHLLVWVPTCAQDIQAAGHSDFYRGAALVLLGFLQMERLLFKDRGQEKIETLDAARARYGSEGKWKGPLFDPKPPPGTSELIEN